MHVCFNTIDPNGDTVDLFEADLPAPPPVGEAIELPDLPHLRVGPGNACLTSWKVVSVLLYVNERIRESAQSNGSFYSVYCEPAIYQGFTPACTCSSPVPTEDGTCDNCSDRIVPTSLRG